MMMIQLLNTYVHIASSRLLLNEGRQHTPPSIACSQHAQYQLDRVFLKKKILQRGCLGVKWLKKDYTFANTGT